MVASKADVTAEARLVRSGPAWLEPVWSDAHWRVYRVRKADYERAMSAETIAKCIDYVKNRLPQIAAA